MQIAQVFGERVSLHDRNLFSIRSPNDNRISADRNLSVWWRSRVQERMRMSTNDNVHIFAFLGDRLIDVQATVSESDNDVHAVCLKDGWLFAENELKQD